VEYKTNRRPELAMGHRSVWAAWNPWVKADAECGGEEDKVESKDGVTIDVDHALSD
jgi:hypothetical protein